MRLWRLVRACHTALDGIGAERHGARYSSPGRPMVNFASEAGLAVLVTQRYLPENRADWPDDFVLGWTDIAVEPERVSGTTDDAICAWVDIWLEEGGQSKARALLAAIPSKVLPEADIIMFNPRHPSAGDVAPLTTRPFNFAECLHRPPMLDTYRNQQ